MDVTNIVAANARKLREQKKLTLDAAAAVTGCVSDPREVFGL